MTHFEMKQAHARVAAKWDATLNAISDPTELAEMLWLALRCERVLSNSYLGTLIHQDNQIESMQSVIRSMADCMDRHGIAPPDLPLEPLTTH